MNSNIMDYVIGVDLGGTNTVFGVVNRRGEIIRHNVIPTCGDKEAREYADRLAQGINQLIESLHISGQVAGIGIGAPCANYQTGQIEAATDLPWPSPIPLCTMITERTGLPCRITNDANAAAMGEMSYGAAKGMKDFIVITLGTGVGSGIVCHGRLISGHRGFAGELGHVKVWRNEGRRCGCGREDCLQNYCSAKGITTTARKMLEKNSATSSLRELPEKDFTPANIFKAAVNGDQTAQDVFEFTGEVLGEACAHFCAFSDPEAIILFGGISKAGDFLTVPMRRKMEECVLHLYKNRVKILTSELKEADAALLGASAIGWTND